MSKVFEYKELVSIKNSLMHNKDRSKFQNLFSDDEDLYEVALESYEIGVLSFLGAAYKQLSGDIDLDGKPMDNDRSTREMLDNALTSACYDFAMRSQEATDELLSILFNSESDKTNSLTEWSEKYKHLTKEDE